MAFTLLSARMVFLLIGLSSMLLVQLNAASIPVHPKLEPRQNPDLAPNPAFPQEAMYGGFRWYPARDTCNATELQIIYDTMPPLQALAASAWNPKGSVRVKSAAFDWFFVNPYTLPTRGGWTVCILIPSSANFS